MLRRFRSLIYEIRWWRWFLFTGHWPTRTLYFGHYYLNQESRRLIIGRIEEEKSKHEPMFEGGYPHRRQCPINHTGGVN